MQPIIECVPNFSEGRDLKIIKEITDAISSVEGINLLDVDPGKATNRTVVTFVGAPDDVVEAAFLGIQKAAELIDMTKHRGEHPRMGATDVCPMIPISGISIEETVAYAKKLGEKVGKDLKIPVYLYEAAATSPDRTNLAVIRAGEYEGFSQKIKDKKWKPDFGPDQIGTAGATVIGVRDFLIAYNINLNTTSVRRANSVAFDIREKGRIARKGNPITGEIIKNKNGQPTRTPGKLKGVKAIGWYIDEYGIAQVSMNITDIQTVPLHIAFEESQKSAIRRGMIVSGSELVGMVPLKVLTDAGKYFLHKQKRSSGVAEKELIHIAVKSMGLDDLTPFDPDKKIIEYSLRKKGSQLVDMDLVEFADLTSSEAPAPGGGSISAYVGALGASLGAMVANLSAGKRGWDHRFKYFSDYAEQGQRLKKELLHLVDEDTQAFNRIIAAFRLPKSTDEEKKQRSQAIQEATIYATQIPLKTMKVAFESIHLAKAMAKNGNPNSVTDAGVGALCAKTAVHGAWLNVKINAKDIKDEKIKQDILAQAEVIAKKTDTAVAGILRTVNRIIA
ncbi:MAG TPA: glutamate formimidoyltransferase [Saprospiraceae bacterium]|nr:glutamate formimidoyltransferase [Saprospiraceae bacterium]